MWRSSRIPRRALTALLACCVALAAVLPAHAAPPAQTAPVATTVPDYTYQECAAVQPEALRDELLRLTQETLDAGRAGISAQTLVDRVWIAENMDSTVNAEVDRAVAALYAGEGYWSRFWSGWSPGKAEEFATAVAADAFGSPAFRTALDGLSTAIAHELALELEAMTARSASTALLCLQTYVGAQYGDAMYTLFEQEVSASIAAAGLDRDMEVDVSLLRNNSKALTGAGIIVVGELVRRAGAALAKKLAGRVTGKVAGRLVGRLGSSIVPIAGWIIGGGLIVWDLIEGGDGALPQIREQLQSEEVKVAIRGEVATAVGEGLRDETLDISAALANGMVTEWRQFCARHTNLCTLPSENAAFKSVLDETSLDQLEPLASLVDAYLETAGRPALDAALDSGAFDRLLAGPAGAAAILRAGGSPETAQAWAALAGASLDEAVALNIPTLAAPEELDAAALAALVAVDDARAVARLLALDRSARDALLQAEPADLRELALAFSADELRRAAELGAAPDGPGMALLVARLAAGESTLAELEATPTAAPAASSAAPAPVAQQPDAALGQPAQPAPAQAARRWLAGQNPVLFASVLVAVLVLIVLLGFVMMGRTRFGRGDGTSDRTER